MDLTRSSVVAADPETVIPEQENRDAGLVMGRFRLLPWEYGVRNLFRRKSRTLLTLLGLTLVIVLVLVVVGFIRGLENSLAVSGDPRVVLIHAPGGAEVIEISTVKGQTAPVLAASLDAIQRRYGQPYVSPEIFLGARVRTRGSDVPALGLVRGVSGSARLVRRQVQITEGHWPSSGEIMAGRLAPAKLGCRDADLAIGEKIVFEGREWTVSGRFAAVGSAFESELWVPLEDLQAVTKRQDYSIVAVTLAPGTSFADVAEFCQERKTMEIEATREIDYYAALQKHYGPVRAMAWLVVLLVAGAGVFAGMNAMYGSVMGRVKELATLQTLGFTRRAITLSLIQESVLLAAAASLLASALALVLLHGAAVRFTMGAFALKIDGVTLLLGCGTGVLLGILGALPPAIQAMRKPVVEALKTV